MNRTSNHAGTQSPLRKQLELLKFAGAKLAGEPGVNFLGAQGDAWDAQWDMLFCLVGATLAVMMFWKLQDRQIAGG